MTDVADDSSRLKEDTENAVHDKLDGIKTDSKPNSGGGCKITLEIIRKEAEMLEQIMSKYLKPRKSL